jgi:hypothetical protein
MATILPVKADTETPLAKNDDHHAALAADPTVSQFPVGSTFGNTTPVFGNSSTAPTFGNTSTNTFGSSSSSGFNTPQSNFGGGFGGMNSFNGGMSPTMPGNTNISMGSSPVLTGAGMNAAMGEESIITNTNESWINNKWRPLMSYMYMSVCIMDFIVFPVLWSMMQAYDHGNVTVEWQPITLQGAGLFHMAMGAVIGVTAYGRTKEKIAGSI